jgi:prepilin-type N-terminal cleavage/methylation domain-containing protein
VQHYKAVPKRVGPDTRADLAVAGWGRRAYGCERGFSITELMIVIAIIGVLTAVASPSISRTLANIRMRSSVKEIAFELQLARLKAITQNTTVTVCFYGPSPDFPKYSNGFFSTYSGTPASDWCPPSGPPSSAPSSDSLTSSEFRRFKAGVRALPVGINVLPPQGILPNRFTFNSMGRVNGDHVDLSNPGTQSTRKIKVNSTGRVRICDPASDPDCD